MTDRFKDTSSGLSGPAFDAFAITPSDANDILEVTRALYIGGGGNITLITKGGTQTTFAGVSAGAILPIRTSRVMATGTSATNIVGMI